MAPTFKDSFYQCGSGGCGSSMIPVLSSTPIYPDRTDPLPQESHKESHWTPHFLTLLDPGSSPKYRNEDGTIGLRMSCPEQPPPPSPLSNPLFPSGIFLFLKDSSNRTRLFPTSEALCHGVHPRTEPGSGTTTIRQSGRRPGK